MPPLALLPFGTLAPLGMSIGLALTIAACGEPAASALSATTFPSDVTTPRRSSNIETAQRVKATFPLLNGSFQFTCRDYGNIVGTIAGAYTGEAQTTSGKPTASLNLTVQRATGVASGLTGLAADGSGAAYLGEGEFALALKLQLPTRNGPISLKVQGTATISCSTQERIVVTLSGTGSSPQLADVEVQLRHEVGNTFCSS
jgi:hypothetical protein